MNVPDVSLANMVEAIRASGFHTDGLVITPSRDGIYQWWTPFFKSPCIDRNGFGQPASNVPYKNWPPHLQERWQQALVLAGASE